MTLMASRSSFSTFGSSLVLGLVWFLIPSSSSQVKYDYRIELTISSIYYLYLYILYPRINPRWPPQPFPPLSTSPFLPPVLALPLSDLSRQSRSLVSAATAETKNATAVFAL